LLDRTKIHEIKHVGNAYGHVKFSNNKSTYGKKKNINVPFRGEV
jgi:hypothetical protein